MSKKNEDSIERFFKKAVTQQDTTFMESDWQKMEKMLDEKAMETNALRSKRLRQGTYSLLGLILISLSIYFLADNSNPPLISQTEITKKEQAVVGAEAPKDEANQNNPTADLLSSAHTPMSVESMTSEGSGVGSENDKDGKGNMNKLGDESNDSGINKTKNQKPERLNGDVSEPPIVNDAASTHKNDQANITKSNTPSKGRSISNSKLSNNLQRAETVASESGKNTISEGNRLNIEHDKDGEGNITKSNEAGDNEINTIGNQTLKPLSGNGSKPSTVKDEASIAKNDPTNIGKGNTASLDQRTSDSKMNNDQKRTGAISNESGDVENNADVQSTVIKQDAHLSGEEDIKNIGTANASLPVMHKAQSAEKQTLNSNVSGDKGKQRGTQFTLPETVTNDIKSADGKSTGVVNNRTDTQDSANENDEGSNVNKRENTSVQESTTAILSDEIREINDSTVTAEVNHEEVTTKSSVTEEKRVKVPSRWSVALVVAPDFSSTALGRYTAPGESFGIIGEFRFLKRMSLRSGILRSTKRYEGYGHEYQPPDGYWQRRTNGIIPEEIYGNCLVYEIPVIIQYTVSEKQKNRFTIGAGVSSYLMDNQSYKYTFENPNPGAATGWSTTESASYPFKVGHLSVAYERKISQRFAVGLEPYLKVPFATMGWSEINLFSSGILINMRYRFLKSEQSKMAREE